jgi:putative transposase
MRAYHRAQVQLSKSDEQQLHALLRGGVQPVRGVLRALALLQLSSGQSAPAVAGNLTLSPKAVRAIARRFQQGGLERALYEKQRPGAHRLLDTAQQQRIVAMACSEPPEGRARWTVRLIVQEAVKRKLVPRVGRETVRILLQSHDLKPWREKNVVRRGTR